jgi:O-antigen/teichoic acid export membrane protein
LRDINWVRIRIHRMDAPLSGSPAAGLPDASRSTRNAGILLVQRALDLLRGLAFAALIPRLLGPEEFGRFSVLSSIALYFALLSGLGSAQLMGRFVPALRQAGDDAGIARLFSGLVSARIVTGSIAALACCAGLSLWLDELSGVVIALTCLAIVLRACANTPFALFLGLDQADRWGAGEVVRRWASLILLVPGAVFFGLDGALGALAIAEMLVLALGVAWARSWLARFSPPTWDEWRPYARYNGVFFVSNALFAVAQQATPSLIRAVSGGYQEVAWFSVAFSAYMLGAAAMWQIAMSFAPLFSSWRGAGQPEEIDRFAGRLLRVVGALGVIATLGATLVGTDLAVVVVGRDFSNAGPLLPLLALTLPFATAGHVGRVIGVAFDRPRYSLAAASLQVVTLVAVGVLLVDRHGARGGAIAVFLSTFLNAAFWRFALRDVAAEFTGGLMKVLMLGAPFMALALPACSLALRWRIAAGVGLVAGFALAATATRVLSAGDLGWIRRSLSFNR